MSADLSQSEFEALRASIAENIKTMDQNEVYLIFGIASIYFLVALDKDTGDITVKFSLWISFFLVVLAFLRYRALDSIIGITNDYLKKLEEYNPSIGWTSFYRDPDNRSILMPGSRYVFWTVLGLLTGMMALYVQFCGVFWR